ncbi:MAG: M28 family peptidase, partial [Bacteroidetes bacterium]|nr:M28 family peptidase [Bacteroidota bacterium]
ESSVQAFGLEAIPSPVPELGLFNRSDNVHFARKGIPAPTFSLGFTAFDEDIQYYYHQPTDESDTINFDYITKYTRSYILSAQQIANAEDAPFWTPGDEYEDEGIELYGTE